MESIFNDGTDDFSYFNNGFFIYDQPEDFKRAVRPLLMEDRVLAVEQKVRTIYLDLDIIFITLTPTLAVLLRQDDGEDSDSDSDGQPEHAADPDKHNPEAVMSVSSQCCHGSL